MLNNEHESTESHESQGLFFQKSQATEEWSALRAEIFQIFSNLSNLFICLICMIYFPSLREQFREMNITT